MSLTGRAFLVLLVVLAAGALAAVVVGWPRLARRGVVPVAGRVGSLLVVNALLAAVAATALNDAYEFYAGWGDLLAGSHQSVLASHHHGAPAAVAVGTALPGSTAYVPPLGALPPLPAGVDAAHPDFAVRVAGASGVRAEVRVALPPAYFLPQDRTRRFPVLEAFHGFPGTDRQWLGMMHLPGALARAVAARHVGPAVVVAPETEVPAGRDTECVDGRRGDPRVGTWLTRDVPAWTLGHLRVDPARTGWATIGLSEGGWCAAYAAMTAPARYSAGVVLSGYFAPEFPSSWVPFAPGSAALQRLDLVRRAATSPPPVALWVQTSKADRLSLPSSTAVARAARPPLSVQLVELARAGHRAQVWRAQLPAALAWLGRVVPGFSPTASGASAS